MPSVTVDVLSILFAINPPILSIGDTEITSHSSLYMKPPGKGRL